MAEWIADIRFDPEVERKIRKRGLTPDQVRYAIALGADDDAAWEDHPKYGSRLVVWGSDLQGPLIAFLHPIDQTDGLWACLTAWRL